jgi:two-component system, NarL family, response regulator NreC
MSIRILIADDHRILRAGLKSLLDLDANLVVVGEATTGREALLAAQELKPDILLLDISMPETDGAETTRALLKAVPGLRVLILTMHEDQALVQEYLRAGASGYIIKRAAESELIDAIYAVWRGMVYIHPSLVMSLVSPAPQPLPNQAQPELLTAREMEVLRLIVQGHTNREISALLNISIRTVETHRSNIMEKLNAHSRVELVRYANQHGLL